MKQYISYRSRYGPGMVIYWFGYVVTIADLDNDILVVCYYPGESFEIKYNRNNRNFVYWRGVDSDWEWTKSKIVQIDSSIIIFDWESRYKNPYFNRIKYEISRNKITWFHSVNKIEPSRDGCAKGEPISPTSF